MRAHKNNLPPKNYLQACSASFPRQPPPKAQSAPFLISTLNTFQGVLKASDCSD